jgi:hypothetical protein
LSAKAKAKAGAVLLLEEPGVQHFRARYPDMPPVDHVVAGGRRTRADFVTSLENVKIKCHTRLAFRVPQFVVMSYWSFVCTVEPMGNSGNPAQRARQRERDQQRRQQVQRAQIKDGHSAAPGAGIDGRGRRTSATACGWCGGPITPRSRGPIPKWCSPTCRHRAWEQARAAASCLSAVRLVERPVEVRVPAAPTRRDWAGLLAELAHQLDDGRVYDRDLPDLASALVIVVDAYGRRPYVRDRSRRGTLPILR